MLINASDGAIPHTLSRRLRQELLSTGYVVVEGVVPTELCEDVVAATAAFLDVDAEDPATWRRRLLHGHGIVPLHHGAALWNLRQHPRIHELFCALYGTEQLWVTMDRVSFKAPAAAWERVEGEPRMSGFHWDADPRQVHKDGFQGLVYLRDTPPEQGAFCCLPAVYAQLSDWLRGRTVKQALKALNAGDEKVQRVGGPAGSMVIWHRRMPHSSARNDGMSPRWVQYVSMDVVGGADERRERIRLYKEKRPPAWAVRQRVPGQRIPEPGPLADLTPLGRKLVGLDEWPASNALAG